MKKIGIKFVQTLSYEQFESFQYLLGYDFEYDDLRIAIEKDEIIPLDMDDEEDYADDVDILKVLLSAFNLEETKGYKLYIWNNNWRACRLKDI